MTVRKKPGTETTKVVAPKRGIFPAQVSLVELDGKEAGTEHFIRGAKNVLGRNKGQADIVLKSKGVSRRHASLSWEKNRLYLEDLKSTNGTFLNEEQITEPVEIRHGDRIKLGDLTLQVIKIEEPRETPVYEIDD